MQIREPNFETNLAKNQNGRESSSIANNSGPLVEEMGTSASNETINEIKPTYSQVRNVSDPPNSGSWIEPTSQHQSVHDSLQKREEVI